MRSIRVGGKPGGRKGTPLRDQLILNTSDLFPGDARPQTCTGGETGKARIRLRQVWMGRAEDVSSETAVKQQMRRSNATTRGNPGGTGTAVPARLRDAEVLPRDVRRFVQAKSLSDAGQAYAR